MKSNARSKKAFSIMQCLFISKYVSTSSLEGRLPTSTYDNAIIHGYKTSCTIQFPANAVGAEVGAKSVLLALLSSESKISKSS